MNQPKENSVEEQFCNIADESYEAGIGIDGFQPCYGEAPICEKHLRALEKFDAKQARVIDIMARVGYSVLLLLDGTFHLNTEDPINWDMILYADDELTPRLFDMPKEMISIKVPVISDWDEAKSAPIITGADVSIPQAWVADLLTTKESVVSESAEEPCLEGATPEEPVQEPKEAAVEEFTSQRDEDAYDAEQEHKAYKAHNNKEASVMTTIYYVGLFPDWKSLDKSDFKVPVFKVDSGNKPFSEDMLRKTLPYSVHYALVKEGNTKLFFKQVRVDDSWRWVEMKPANTKFTLVESPQLCGRCGGTGEVTYGGVTMTGRFGNPVKICFNRVGCAGHGVHTYNKEV